MDSPTSAAAFEEGTYCPDCGYDLRGITAARCPECGLGLEFIHARERIPWEQRRKRGRLRAYIQTVLLPARRLARATCLPVGYRDARRFQSVTVLLTFISTVVAVGLLLSPRLEVVVDFARQTAPWYIGWLAACWLLTLFGLTGVPSYLFHPRRLPISQQNRAIATSYYACAPLALSPFLVVLSAIAVVAENLLAEDTFVLVAGALAVVPVVYPVLYWFSLLRIAKYVLRGSGGLVVGALAPVLWLAIALLCLGLLPFLGRWVGIFICSWF